MHDKDLRQTIRQRKETTMKLIKTNCRVSIVERKGFEPRFNLIVELENKKVPETRIGKNYANMELTPAKPLTLADVQYLLLAKGQAHLLNTAKAFRFKDVKAEALIGHYKESGDPYYLVRVYLLDDLVKSCYLTPSQVKSLPLMDLGFEFEEDNNEVASIDEVEIDTSNKPVKNTNPKKE